MSSNSTTSRKTKLARVLLPTSDAWQLELLEILEALEARHHLRLGILFPFAQVDLIVTGYFGVTTLKTEFSAT